jgi:hypothetical protein
LQFTVSQQQRAAEAASLRLTQYLVRLPDSEDKAQAKRIVKEEKDKRQAAVIPDV